MSLSTLPNQSEIQQAAEILDRADALLITAGAGMGVDSGLPDFRGNEGFWKAYPVAKERGLSFTDLASPSAFEDDPQLAWAFYGHRLELYRATLPHTGFRRLLQFGQCKPSGYFVFTSNVDGQFQKAGFDERRIVECHGSIHHLQCAGCCTNTIWSAMNTVVLIDERDFSATGELPSCQNCGYLARPNILMFNDYAWVHERTAQQQKRMYDWWQFVTSSKQEIAVIEFGAGTSVATVRRQSESMIASYKGTNLIRVNTRDAEVPGNGISLPIGASDGIDRILDCL